MQSECESRRRGAAAAECGAAVRAAARRRRRDDRELGAVDSGAVRDARWRLPKGTTKAAHEFGFMCEFDFG